MQSVRNYPFCGKKDCVNFAFVLLSYLPYLIDGIKRKMEVSVMFSLLTERNRMFWPHEGFLRSCEV